MIRRLLPSFLIGAVFFTVLPIYAPFVVLQTEEMPRFLLGLGAGVIAGVALALINGAARGLLLVLMCALIGACIYVFVYAVRTFGPLGGVWPTVLSFALAYLVLPAAVGVGLVVLPSSFLARRGRTVRQSARVPTPEADVSVPPPPWQPPTVATGEGVGASLSRQRRRNPAVLLLIGAIVLAGIVGFLSALVMNLQPVEGPSEGPPLAEAILFSLANGLIKSVEGAIIVALVVLLGGGVVYLLDRNRRGSANTRITFLQAALSWRVLVIAAGLVFLMSLRDVVQAFLYA